MPHKESRLGQYGGRFEPASIDLINAVLAEDRLSRENYNGVRLYLDTPTPAIPTAAELLSQIDHEALDPIQQLLAQALETQASVPLRKDEQDIASSVTTHEAVRKYKNTARFRQRQKVLQGLRAEGLSAEGARSDFVGVTFADIAQSLYRPSLTEGTLISDEATYSFFSELMDGKIPTEHPYGVKSLLGVTVPDGMVVGVEDNKPSLLKFVEYSIAFKGEKYTSQFAAYEKDAKRLVFESPSSLSADFGVDFVVPRRTYEREYPALSGDIGARYHHLDQIDSVSFGHEIDAILADHYRASFPQRSHSRR